MQAEEDAQEGADGDTGVGVQSYGHVASVDPSASPDRLNQDSYSTDNIYYIQ